jgi:hypothetical protein
VPDGDVRDLLAPLGHAALVRPADVTAMAEALRTRIDAGAPGPVSDGVGSPALAGYDRRRLVARLAGTIDGVLAAQPADAARR